MSVLYAGTILRGWLVVNVVVAGLAIMFWRRWAGRREELREAKRAREELARRSPLDMHMPDEPNRVGRAFVILFLLFILGTWLFLGVNAALMETETSTSKLTVQSATVSTDAQGDQILTLHLHLDSGLPTLWGVYFLVDGQSASAGFSGSMNFSSPDEVVQIDEPEGMEPGWHTLTYGFGFLLPADNQEPCPPRGCFLHHGDAWTITEGQTVGFQVGS